MHDLELALKKCHVDAASDTLTAIAELSREPESKHAYVAERLYVASKRGSKEGEYFAVSLPHAGWRARDIYEAEERDALAAYRLGLSHAKFSKDVVDTLTYAVRVLASHPPEEQNEICRKLTEVVRSESRNLDLLPTPEL